MIAIAMIRFAATLALCALAGSAAAQTVVETGSIAVSRQACVALVEHIPDADVEYRAGVDATGRPVVPAEGDEHRFEWEPPETFAFDLIVDLEEFFGPGAPHFTRFVDDIPIGEVVVRHGRVSVDGQPVTDRGTAQLAEACRQLYGGG